MVRLRPSRRWSVARVLRTEQFAPYPLADGDAALFRDAVGAWREGLRALGLPPGALLLVPEGHAPNLRRAATATGLRLRDYPASLCGEPAGDLDALADEDVGGLVLVHGLGIAQDAAPWRAWCDERGALLLEDVEDSWPASVGGRMAGTTGDLAVYDPSRVLCGSCGAALVVRDETLTVHGDAPSSLGSLLPRVADDHFAAIRRAHFDTLADLLPGRCASSQPAPPGSSPLLFPVTASGDAELGQRLAARRIDSLSLGDTVVGVPVQQSLTFNDLDRIADAVDPARTPPVPLRCERVDSLDDARDDWSRLAQDTRNVFSTWEFAETWWRHFGAGLELQVHRLVDADGRVVAILPLHLDRARGARVMRFLGHGVADELRPVCADADRPAVARAFRELMGTLRGWDVLLAERVPADHAWDALLGGQVVHRESSPVLDLGAPWDEVSRRLSNSLRKKIGRSERALQRDHDLTYRLTTGIDTLDADLDILFRLHDARWDGASDAFSPERAAFHRDFAAQALERGWLRLWTADAGSRPGASWLGLRFGDVDSFYQTGRDPDLDRTSIGLTILGHSMREAADDGQTEYRLLRGNESYKKRFASRDSPVHVVAKAHGAAPRALLTAAQAASRTSIGRRAVSRSL